MKPFLISAAGLLLVGVGYISFLSNPSTITNYPPEGTSIVAFGDSLVEGVGATSGHDFVSVLSQRLDEPIVNLGKRGDTTADALTRVDQVIEQNPKVVIVLLGGNDYLQQIPKETTFSNLDQIVTTIHESGAVVVLLGVPGGLLRDGYKSEFESLAQSRGTAYVPNVLAGLLGNADLMSDTVHPNDSGYQVITDKVEPVVSGLTQ